jgi:Glyoxalase-like domain
VTAERGARSARMAPDHLVVAARTLDEGAAWCEATLGVVPAPGGKHPLMATHNRLLAIGSPRFPRTYLEIIAIDPQAPAPQRPRWFDLDAAELHRAIAAAPRLVHWVARTADIEAGAAALRRAGFDPGAVTAAERMTPRGLLRWRITVRDDGGRAARGAVPLLIEWGDEHPSDAVPESAVRLEAIALGGIAKSLAAWLGVDAAPEQRPPASPLCATLDTPRGRVELRAPGGDES